MEQAEVIMAPRHNRWQPALRFLSVGSGIIALILALPWLLLETVGTNYSIGVMWSLLAVCAIGIGLMFTTFYESVLARYAGRGLQLIGATTIWSVGVVGINAWIGNHALLTTLGIAALASFTITVFGFAAVLFYVDRQPNEQE